MLSLIPRFLILTLAGAILTGLVAAQSAPKTAASDTTSSTQKGISLAETGHCREALPILKKSALLTPDKQLKLRAGLATVRCGLSLNQTDAAVNALLSISTAYPASEGPTSSVLATLRGSGLSRPS